MEGFNSMIRVAIQNHWIRGFAIGNLSGEEMQICHLLYADDIIIFCEAKASQISFIRTTLVIFEAVSGLSINWRKSCIFPFKEVPQIQSLATILGCRVEQLPTTYLGMPLGHNHKELEIWDGIIEKIEKKLVNWKAQYISLGGRVTLINFVLDSLPTYVMSLFPIPAKVEERLDKLRRDFLWLGNKEGKGPHLFKWQVVQLHKQSGGGGLGIRNLRIQNACLLSKWLWRFTRETHALWREVIVNKYDMDGKWCSNLVNDTYGVSVWRTIRNLWPNLIRNIDYKVGSGTKTSFWKENWIGNESLMVLFPDLLLLSINPEETVADVWSQQGWNIVFRRFLNDWEIRRVAAYYKYCMGLRGQQWRKTLSDGDIAAMGCYQLTDYISRK
ncbi:hypothetical protein MTR67_040899 [Solanum verrucosum]|uniref:Uncharacterized protein n=1 Tax=Solanum verrucosum TaxID=315347 RepID=A0AAF0UKE0_SOLVR|nr:hypothetical protein MTR67_040899 [Solanum verrucosum]